MIRCLNRADGGVRNVYVRADDAAWPRAELEAPRGREWQRFSMRWSPSRRGPVVIASMAEAMNGVLQSASGRRDAIYGLPVDVS